MSDQNPTDQQQQQQQQQQNEPLALPSTDGSDTTRLDLSSGSSSAKLDHLGPLVVNQDGSLSRITNWGQMTEIEKKNTLRILGKRNQLRTARLKGEEGQSGSTGDDGKKQ